MEESLGCGVVATKYERIFGETYVIPASLSLNFYLKYCTTDRTAENSQ